jgi:hypothetical protein
MKIDSTLNRVALLNGARHPKRIGIAALVRCWRAGAGLAAVLSAGLAAVLALVAALPPAHAQAPATASSVAQDTNLRDSGPDLSGYVSLKLNPVEQDYMRGAINQLPATMKEKFLNTDPSRVALTVYDGATGEMHYNRPELEGNLKLEQFHALPGDDYPLAKAQTAVATDGSSGAVADTLSSCGASPAPGCFSGGGPYRRVFTPKLAPEKFCPSGVRRPCPVGSGTATGYWNAGTVTTACNAGSFKKGDHGFVLLGAYSTKPSEAGGSVDGGLLYNYEDDPADPTLDEYRLFLGILDVAKLVYTSTDPPGGESGSSIRCGGNSTMEFRVAPWELGLNSRAGSGCVSSKKANNPWELEACATVAFIIERGTGGIGEQHNEEAIVWLAPSISYGGWGEAAISNQATAAKPNLNYWPEVPCGGCIFKWITTIGQDQQNLTDGSIFSATWSNRKIAPWATDPGDVTLPAYGNPVAMTEKLTLCTEYPLWRGTYDETTATEDCSDTPKNITGNAGDVKVANYAVDGELDSITLTEKGTPTVAEEDPNPEER